MSKPINMVIKLFDTLFHFFVMKDGRDSPPIRRECKLRSQEDVTMYVPIAHGVKPWGFKTLAPFGYSLEVPRTDFDR